MGLNRFGQKERIHAKTPRTRVVDQINTDNRKILLHKKEVDDYLRGGVPSPITVEVDPSLSCGHRCPNCTYGQYHKRCFISDRVADKIIESLPGLGVKGMIITGGGEPCLFKNLGQFVKATDELGVDVTLTTNGQQFDRHLPELMQRLKRVRFSIDAATPEAFRHTHGMQPKDFAKVIENLKAAVSYKKRYHLGIDIGVSYLICDENFGDLEQAVDLYRRIGVDFLHFKPMQYGDPKSMRYYHKPMPNLDRLIAKFRSFDTPRFHVTISREAYYNPKSSRIPYQRCHGAHFDIIIGADGRVYTCCHFKYHSECCYGDLGTADFQNILQNVRDAMTPACFPDCKMDAVNQLIEAGRSNPETLLDLCETVSDDKLELGSKWL